MAKTAMIKLKNSVSPLKTKDNFDFAQANLVINRHFGQKVQDLEAALRKLSNEWTFETFDVVLSGFINPDKTNPLASISFDWPESLEPEVNEQIQLLKDNFYSGQ